jgi:enoyl-CoA hydratase
MTTATDDATDVILYHVEDGIATITMNRPEVRNAQNSAMTYALDDAFHRAAQDDAVKVIVLAGAGPHFSGGHDIGSKGRDMDKEFPRLGMTWNHLTTTGIEGRYAREREVYLDMCLRWREIPKPTIARVQGACIGGALMLVWCCDLIIAADDATFSDPVVRMGAPGVEYFVHPWQMGARFAKEFLFLGERVHAQRARELGMVNRVVPRAELETATSTLAQSIATMPRFALALAKQSVNRAEDAMGLRQGLETSFALHQLAHAHAVEVSGSPILAATPKSMASDAKNS